MTLDKCFKAKYIQIESEEDIIKLQGSKYVQGDSQGVFKIVGEYLLEDRKVLFSGTSCVISGLYSFLAVKKIATDNLITCDFICHGVSSPILWEEHIKLQQRRFGTLTTANFRDKRYGWRSCIETYEFECGKIVSEYVYDDLYFSHAALRDSCYNCEYVDVEKRPADITMGDFFGEINDELLLDNDDSGISVAVCHSRKGKNLLMKADLVICKTVKGIALKNNLTKSAVMPKWRTAFWNLYKNLGYEACLKKYTVYGGIGFKLKRKALQWLGRW